MRGHFLSVAEPLWKPTVPTGVSTGFLHLSTGVPFISLHGYRFRLDGPNRVTTYGSTTLQSCCFDLRSAVRSRPSTRVGKAQEVIEGLSHADCRARSLNSRLGWLMQRDSSCGSPEFWVPQWLWWTRGAPGLILAFLLPLGCTVMLAVLGRGR